ncbi:MAG: acetyl-CoA hydrolase/transferase C-terminal domain-containing protein [Chloroflexota bacterium]|nr:acetyl-CoA hydrolase/transferase C-terminal domain-containing protein [Chloroflexota bacterium]
MDWREEYKRKLVTAEEAVKAIKPGHRVAFINLGMGLKVLPPALVARARAGELWDVEVLMCGPHEDFGWLEPDCRGAFTVAIETYMGGALRHLKDERRADFVPVLYSLRFKAEDERPGEARATDVFMTAVSPPDDNGFCSFGQILFNKKLYAQRAKTVLAEVDRNQIRTCGDNFIHVSEIDYFVEHTPPEREVQPLPPIEDSFPGLAEHIATLVKDGDTIQTGAAPLVGPLLSLGMFDQKHDLGFHTEIIPWGVVKLVREGVITGRRKTLHPGKVVATTFATYPNEEELRYLDNNPLFELYGVDYVNNIKIIAAHDNMVAINSALSMDLTGQVTVETIFGQRLWNGPGGFPDFLIGAALSKGGRSILAFPSTAMGGTVSRIVPLLEEGSAVTAPRTFTDYVVTEYGIARLWGKSFRQRAEELIAIAHPDFRSELKKQAQKLFYP